MLGQLHERRDDVREQPREDQSDLRLSIAHKAMRAHDGDIYIKNVPGTGCISVIEMPLAEARAGEM